MIDVDPWQSVHPGFSLYRYQGKSKHTVRSESVVLMLHGPMTSHQTWDAMGEFLWQQGFENLFAIDIEAVQMGGSLRPALDSLRETVAWLLDQCDPTAPGILIGHSTGGVLARRFLLKGESALRFVFAFTLGSPHSLTHLSYQVYVPENIGISDTHTGSYVRTPKVPQDTFFINIIGSAEGPYFDGTVRGVFLPEAINIITSDNHAALKHSSAVMSEMLACLQGERYRMQVFLQSLLMKTPDDDGLAGPFCFEINGMRTPFTGSFQALPDHPYQFEEDSTPIATLAYGVDQSLASTLFRLKDMSRTRQVRRRLFTKLLDSLVDRGIAVHEMQDNEGSKIIVRVHTRRMPSVLAKP